MKLLLDQNISPRLIKSLESLYPGSSHVQSLGLGYASDKEVWEHARRNDFIIVTKDADFSERGTLSGFPPKIIWIRYGNCPTGVIETILHDHYDDVLALTNDDNTGILVIL